MNNYFKRNYFWMLCLLVIIAVSSYLFGWNGFVVIAGMLILFFFPFYLTIRNFDLEQDEKIFFSFFASIGIFPFIVYAIYPMIKSLRASIAVTFVLLLGIGIALYYYRKNKAKKTGKIDEKI